MGMKLYAVLLQEWERKRVIRVSWIGYRNLRAYGDLDYMLILHRLYWINHHRQIKPASLVYSNHLCLWEPSIKLFIYSCQQQNTLLGLNDRWSFCKTSVLSVCLCLVTFTRWPGFCERAIWFPNNGNSITKWRSFNCFRAPIHQPPLSLSLPFSLSFFIFVFFWVCCCRGNGREWEGLEGRLRIGNIPLNWELQY